MDQRHKCSWKLYFLSTDFLLMQTNLSRDRSLFLPALYVSLWQTLALSQCAMLTLFWKQAVLGQFVIYLNILLFLSISSGT